MEFKTLKIADSTLFVYKKSKQTLSKSETDMTTTITTTKTTTSGLLRPGRSLR